jgi:beta-phosphoglucomutase
MSMIKAFIFDLDGVIVDTARYHYLTWRRLANELGVDFTEERNELLKGVGRMESLELILGWGQIHDLSEEEKEALADKKNGWYQAYVRDMDAREILPGVVDFLEKAHAMGVLLAIGSGSKNARTIIAQTGLASYFSALVDGNELTRSKPDPEVFLLAARALGQEPANCVVFEDAARCIDAALGGGFYAVGVGEPAALGHAQLVINDFAGLEPAALIQQLAQ